MNFIYNYYQFIYSSICILSNIKFQQQIANIYQQISLKYYIYIIVYCFNYYNIFINYKLYNIKFYFENNYYSIYLSIHQIIKISFCKLTNGNPPGLEAPGRAEDTRLGSPPEEPQYHIFTYESPWKIYALGHSWRPDQRFRFAIGSFLEDKINNIEIVSLSEEAKTFVRRQRFDHQYPPTKIMWIPDENGTKPDLLATSGEYLRIFMIDSSNNTSTLKSELKNIKQAEYSAPLTSFDWNVEDPNILGTCSIDTTCTIWDLEKECVKTQLIAHDKEVYDMAFAQGLHTFASAGADGSIRHFDTRNLEHSTIIFESPDQTPFLRVVWNRADPHYIATIMMDSPKVTIVDIRYPMLPFMELQGHSDCVNSISWAPTSSIHICTAGDDSQTLIWDLLGPQDRAPTDALEPMLAYKSEAEVTMIQWPTPNPAWISIAFNNKMQMLKVQHAYSLNDVIF